MIVKNADDVESGVVKMDGVKGAHIQWLASKTDGALNFAMRRFKLVPGGKIGLHEHAWEHEIYILSGKGVTYNESETRQIGPGDVIFIPGNEPHGYDNTGDEDLVFICMVPNSGDPR
jgi:quercetin dioxygenase-like cupin family protein